MKNIVSKTFIQALGLLSDNPKKAKSFIKDNRLSHSEKTILAGFILLRENKYAEIEASLRTIKVQDQVVEAQRLFLLGIAANDQGRCLESLAFYRQSLELMELYPLDRQKFMVNHALFIAYRNLKDKDGMRQALYHFEDHTPRDINEKILIQRSTFYFLSYTGDFHTASKVLLQLNELAPAMNDVQGMLFQMDRFDFAIKLEDYRLAQQSLIDLKQFRAFGSSANYKFMKALLGLIRDSSPLYLYDKDFSENPLLFHQVKVLLSLESGSPEIALTHWNELGKLSPGVYQADFHYVGDVCLFSRALTKLLIQRPSIQLSDEHKLLNKEDLLLTLLRNSSAPLPKDYLYEQLWGTLPQDKKDFEKLSSMLLRLKKKHLIDVKFKRGCYALLPSGKTKVS